jgi:quinol monooxygenase YgiN
MMNRRTMGITALCSVVMFGANAQAANKKEKSKMTKTSSPPVIATPANAQRVTITLRLTAKDGDAFARHLLSVIPVTRVASGCRYSHTFRDPAKASEFLLIQGWDSAEQQQGYIGWRQSTGDLDRFLAFLEKPPVIETFHLLDA